MDMLVLIAGIIVVVLAVGYMLYPLFRGMGQGAASLVGTDSELADLLSERDAVLQTLRDLDFDHRMGKLSDPDYQALRAQYAARGVAVLQHLDAAAGLTGEADAFDAEIEAEVRRLRGEPAREIEEVIPAEPVAVGLEEAIEEEVRKLRARPAPASASVRPKPARRAAPVQAGPAAARCPDCGKPCVPGDKFCAHCGGALARVCPSCGATAAPEARFCAQCGAKLPAPGAGQEKVGAKP